MKAGSFDPGSVRPDKFLQVPCLPQLAELSHDPHSSGQALENSRLSFRVDEGGITTSAT